MFKRGVLFSSPKKEKPKKRGNEAGRHKKPRQRVSSQGRRPASETPPVPTHGKGGAEAADDSHSNMRDIRLLYRATTAAQPLMVI